MINSELQALAVKIDVPMLDPDNPNDHSERNLEAILNSLGRVGQQKPIVLDENNVCIAGNGTLIAARKLGWDEIAVVKFDKASAADRAFYRLADNRTSELSEWVFPKLSEQLKWLQEQGEELLDLGWDKAELDLLLNAAWQKDEGELPGTAAQTHGTRPLVISSELYKQFEKACAIINAASNIELSEQHCFGIIIGDYLARHQSPAS